MAVAYRLGQELRGREYLNHCPFTRPFDVLIGCLQGVDYAFFATGLLMLPEGIVITGMCSCRGIPVLFYTAGSNACAFAGKIAIALAKFAMKSTLVRSIANVFRAAETSSDAAAAGQSYSLTSPSHALIRPYAAAQGVSEAASKAEKELQGEPHERVLAEPLLTKDCL